MMKKSRELSCIVMLGVLAGLPLPVFAETEGQPPKTEQVIQPQIDRRDIKLPRIDTENFEIGVYGGILSVEDFGTKPVSGVRVAYHVSEDFFIEGVYGKSTVSDENYRIRAIPIFVQSEVDLKYYNISVGVNLFPGEIFITDRWAMSSAFYLIGGIGNTNFNEEDFSAVNFGVGLRLLITDWFAWHFDMRDHIWESDLLGINKRTHNFEMHTGFTIFF